MAFIIKRFLIFLLLIIPGLMFSQTLKTIDSATKKPIDNVQVSFRNEMINISNKYGILNFDTIKIGTEDTLKFSHTTYETEKIIFGELKTRKNIELSPKTEELSEVLLNSKRRVNPQIIYEILPDLPVGVYAADCAIIGDKLVLTGGNISVEDDALEKVKTKNPEVSIRDIIEAKSSNLSFYKLYDKIQLFDLKKKSWTVIDRNLTKRAYHRLEVYNKKLYSIGGLTTNSKHKLLNEKIEVFNLYNDSISVDYSNPHQAANFASIIYKNNLILFGGSIKENYNGKKDFSKKIHSLDLNKGLWYDLGNMPSAKETQCILIKDNVFFIGGYQNKNIGSIERFNLITGEWFHVGDLYKPISNPSITSNEEDIYIYSSGSIFSFNTRTSTLAEFEINLHLDDPNIIYYNDKIYIIGGIKNDSYTYRPSNEFYSIGVEQFRKTIIKKSLIFQNESSIPVKK